jgi:hypothetical protein
MSPSRVGTPKDHNGPSLRDWGRSFLRLRVFIPDRRHHPGVNGQAAWAMRPSHRRILHSYFRAGCGSSGSRHKCEHINHITLNYIGFLRLYIPCAMVLTAAPRSPWCTGLVSHHRLRGVSGPSGPTSPSRKLDTRVGVSGPHGLAVRKDAFRRRASAEASSRPSHPASNVRDDRDTPLLWRRDGQRITMYFCKTEEKDLFFSTGLDMISD